jgi:hypothetical protein
MDIVVHGTKGGLQIFTTQKKSGLLDVNSDSSKATAIGQEAFAIRYIENSVIFSKYKIIRDVRGNKRTGFLGFSLFLNNNKKLTGSNLISVLNKVSAEYCKTYIPENDNNLKDVRENWDFLDLILNEYKGGLLDVAADVIENLVSGTKDDAYIFFKNQEELEKYFDSPYKPLFSPYRQVLFVQEKFKDKPENPLNALRYSVNDNLTGAIDLNEKTYSLREYEGQAKDGISIEIRVNSRLLYKKDKINSQDIISVRYFKKYFHEIKEEGKLYDDKMKNYLLLDENNRKIDVKKDIKLSPCKKTIFFNVMEWGNRKVYSSKINCQSANGESRTIDSNQVTFEGLDLGKRWRVWVSTNDNRFFSEEIPINFEEVCPNENGNLDIILKKHKIDERKIKVNDESNGEDLNNFTLSKKEFSGNEIIESHNITISHYGYESKTLTYCPISESYPEPIKLRRKKNWTEPNRGSEILGVEKENIPTPNVNEQNKINIVDQNNKIILLSVISVIVIVLGIIVFEYWENFQPYFKVDNVNQNTSPASEPKIPSDSRIKNEPNNGTSGEPVTGTNKGQNAELSKGKETQNLQGKKTESVELKPNTKTGKEQVLPTPNSDTINSIVQKLKTDKVTKNDLEEWKKSGNVKINKAVNLYSRFWEFLTSYQQEDFQILLNEIKKDDILKNSELNSFLNKICNKSTEDFEKFKGKDGKAACKTLADLKK